MEAAIVIKTKNGYVVVPASEVPAFSTADAHVAMELESPYSYGKSPVINILKELFEPTPTATTEAAL